MTLTGDWLTNRATQRVLSVLENGGARAYLVGGCVRNALLDAPVGDIDVATDIDPQRVTKIAKAAGLKVIPTGIDHGTVTLIADGLPHEVTTFRKDVATDGRRAIVSFSDRIEDDAARRDFTMNALYVTADGTLLDPLNGMPDLQNRHVRFIGDANARIREDYLRSLRYFRFHAWYGDAANGFDPEALHAIASNLDGLKNLSRERVGSEIVKLLGAPDPAPSVAAMRQAGVLLSVLPGSDDRALAPMIHLEHQANVKADPLRRLAALGGQDVAQSLRLSRAQIRYLTALKDGAFGSQTPCELGYRLGAQAGCDALILRAVVLEQPLTLDDLGMIHSGADKTFPITAKDLMPQLSGPDLGDRLRQLESAWIQSGFLLDRAALLALE